MIAGHYRLVEHIGSGAMGVVWRATDVRLERTVAIKQILPQPGVSETERDNMRQRAMREAKNAARFQHPNAIVVFDIAEHNGDPCLVMEYLDGPSLSTILAEEGTLPLGRVARIGEQVASALVAAHRAGIVHRDVKPGNILIDKTGTAKITDFGISRAAGDMTLTATGLIGGTPAYLAPELARGADPVPSSDVFALGATLYQAIEGTTPYGNTTNQLALLYAAANGQINPPVQAGAATALLMSLLRSEPGERPSMAEARERLAALARTEPGGMTASPPLLSGGAGRKPAAPADGGERPPWQRTDSPAPSSPPVGTPVPANKAPSEPPRPTAAFMPMRSPAAPPNTPPRPMPAAAPTARAPQYSTNTAKPDTKRKFALFAGAGAAVVVVAVIVFLVLNSGGGGTGGTTNAQSPGNQPTMGQSSSKTNSPSTSAVPAELGKAPTSGKIDFTPAGLRVIAFYSFPEGAAASWAMLTPAAQQVYGSQEAFNEYWSKFKSVSAKRASGAFNDDGSVTITATVVFPDHEEQHSFRIVNSGGQLLIDAQTKGQADVGQ
ncbi:protein kinase [Amycolatopsis sp. NEAU-NG30]|uniref:non-specific serine/threonine protein kinase n=1 Tax=Amycolatopsis melonis TaxID=3156488 RepID=A0ABV0L8B2_9PSEU